MICHCQTSVGWDKFAIYKYDGAIRARYGEGGWVKVENNVDKLEKNQGYIIQSAVSGDIEFKVPNLAITCNNYERLLQTYNSALDYNANWSLIGNPFPSYFDLDELFTAGFSAPIYVRSKDKDDYDVYMPNDDEYHFHPYEAFFVQNPGDMIYNLFWGADGRETYKQSQENDKRVAARRMAQQKGRQFVELRLSAAEQGWNDHTRVVFNDNAKSNYELGRDAVKMSGKAAVRLYSLDDETQYAINERPYDNGYVQLGFSVAQEGEYTLSATRLDTAVIIYDNVEKQEVDLSYADYHFHSKAGVDNERFSIFRVKEAVTSLDELREIFDGNVNVYTVSGIVVRENVSFDNLNLPTGAYIIQSDHMTRTIILK